MGLGGISIWQLLIILIIILLLFGTKRLKSIGSDVGEAIRGFRNSMSDAEREDQIDSDQDTATKQATNPQGQQSRSTQDHVRHLS